jgi:hypothetical protein
MENGLVLVMIHLYELQTDTIPFAIVIILLLAETAHRCLQRKHFPNYWRKEVDKDIHDAAIFRQTFFPAHLKLSPYNASR